MTAHPTDPDPTPTALTLRVHGLPYSEIAAQLGHPNTDHTRRVVRAELAQTPYAMFGEDWAVHVLRLDSLVEVLRATVQTRHPTEQAHAEQVLADTLTERQTTLDALTYQLAQQRAEQAAQQPTATTCAHRPNLRRSPRIGADHDRADPPAEDTPR